jgi:Tfp pilus assembly protein PilO
MKGFIEFFLKRIHLLIFLNTSLAFYTMFNDYYSNFESFEQKMSEIKSSIDLQEKKNTELIKFKANIKESKEKLTVTGNQLESIKRQLPPTIDDGEITDFLVGEASGLNLKEILVNPLSEIKFETYFSKNYQFSSVGTMLQTIILLERIGLGERFFNVVSLNLEKNKNIQKGRFQLLNIQFELQTFRYNNQMTQKEMN